MISIAVHGAAGRMGVLVTELVSKAEDMDLVGLISEPGKGKAPGEFHPDLPLTGQEEMEDSLSAGTVIIDFSLAAALDGLLDQGQKIGSPLVVGTTGFSAEQQEKLVAYAREFPVVQAANFSIGIPALQMLLQLLARTLPQGFDAEQIETHHITKLDKPSGTARTLGKAWEELRGGSTVPTHSQRLGGVIGEHTWTFSDQEETLVLTHRAHSRQAFLRGILPAARFAATQKNGLFGLVDVLKKMAGPV